jgi:hypothetical protein
VRTFFVGGPHHGLALIGGLGPERVAPMSSPGADGGGPVFRAALEGEPCYARRIVASAAVVFHGVQLAVGDEAYEWQEGDLYDASEALAAGATVVSHGGGGGGGRAL